MTAALPDCSFLCNRIQTLAKLLIHPGWQLRQDPQSAANHSTHRSNCDGRKGSRVSATEPVIDHRFETNQFVHASLVNGSPSSTNRGHV
jgi:hypothetical protein